MLIGLWFLLVVLIPILFFRTLSSYLYKDLKGSGRILKSVLAVIIYPFLSLFSGFALIFIIVGPDPKAGRESLIEVKQFIAGLAIIISFGLTGWALCCFVAGEKVTSKIFKRSDKHQSILEGE